MRITLRVLLLLFFATAARAQNADDRSGFTFGAQSGFEYLHYTENFRSAENLPYAYDGSSFAIVGTFSVEYDLSVKFHAPFFIAISGGIPLVNFSGEERLTFDSVAISYLTQTNRVEHEYRMVRAFFGYKAKPEFSPFILFERALLHSTRWDRLSGSDEGILVKDFDSNVTWHERVWSSHFGAGFQGGIPLNDAANFSVKYRLAALFPLSSFVTNDHPSVYSQGRKLGQDASGFTALARVALQYDWSSRSSLQFGVNIYTRNWDGDGASTSNAYWPSNTMDAIPILLGVTWAI
jgi:hypothetical protein